MIGVVVYHPYYLNGDLDSSPFFRQKLKSVDIGSLCVLTAGANRTRVGCEVRVMCDGLEYVCVVGESV